MTAGVVEGGLGATELALALALDALDALDALEGLTVLAGVGAVLDAVVALDTGGPFASAVGVSGVGADARSFVAELVAALVGVFVIAFVGVAEAAAKGDTTETLMVGATTVVGTAALVVVSPLDVCGARGVRRVKYSAIAANTPNTP